jgi:glycosyltransferase involved in cell wall biosynthesis
MRILLVSQEYPPETAKGGVGTQTYVKAHGLAALGHEVHVLSRSPQRVRHEYRDGEVYVTRIAGFYDRMPLHTMLAEWVTYSAEVAAEIASLHQRRPLGLIDFPEWGSEGYVHLLNQTEWNHIPTLVQIHGPIVLFAHTLGWPDPESDAYRVLTEMERFCLQHADAVYSSSACSRDWCVRHYGLDAEQIPVLHTGVDTQRFFPQAGVKETRPTIVFMGRLTPHKGADLLVEAACRLGRKYPDLQLRMLGKGDDAFVDRLRSKTAEHGLPDLLDLPGFVAREELPAQLSRAHVFAAPSKYEPGPGLVCLEAMACGLPVVACDGAGAAEVVTSGRNGFLVPPGDSEALAERLGTLLADSQTREHMAAHARDDVQREADSALCLRRLEAFYQAVAGKGRKEVR